MTHLLSKKQRLISKRKELNETWDDVQVFISQHIKKLNYIVDAVLDESDSVSFFQSYPKVSCHVDKVLNIFLQVQCKLNIFTCEDIFASCYVINHEGALVEKDYGPSESKGGNRQISDAEELSVLKTGALEKVDSTPEVVQFTRQVPVPEDLSIIKDGAAGQDLCNSFEKVCPAAERVVVENCTPFAVDKCSTKKQIAGFVDQAHSAEIRSVCDISEELKVESGNLKSTKKRITHSVIKANEVLEMVYSHGDSPWNFWLCYYPLSDIEFLQKSVKSMYDSKQLEALSVLPEVGDHVLVADGKRFLRGQVLTVRGTDLLDTTCVMLLDLDSGRMKSFKMGFVWKIPEELMCVQAQAVNCQLQGIMGDCSIWCKENLRKYNMDRRFEELLQTTLSVKFIGTLSDSSVPRYIIDADCINVETDKIYNVSQCVNNTIIPVIMREHDVQKCMQKDEAIILQNSNINEICGNLSLPHEDGADSVVNVANAQQVLEKRTDNMNITEQQPNDANEIVRNIISVSCEHGADSIVNVANAQQVSLLSKCTDGVNITQEQTNEISGNIICVSCEHGVDSAQQVHKNCTDGICHELSSPSPHSVESSQGLPLYEVDIDSNSWKLNDSDCAELLSLCGTSYSDVEVTACTDDSIKKASDFTATEVLSDNENCVTTPSVVASIYCSRDTILEKRNYSSLLDKTIPGILTIVDSPSLFCMQFVVGANDEFAYIYEKMNIFYSENKIKFSTKEAAQNIIKSFCAAMYPEDGKWYRAEIIDWMPTTETSVCVCFVDVGDKMVLEIDLIQPLAKQFAGVPVLSQRCHLYNVAPIETARYSYVSYEWSGHSLSLFRDVLTSGQLYTMHVKEFTSYGSVGVILIDPESPEMTINEKLLTIREAKSFLNENNLSLWDPMKAEYERCAHYSYNDEDACEAVTGYSPNDEQRFCKFYARHGRCFKGSNCRKEHVLSHPGGWISDKEEVFQNAFSQIKLPEVGETIFLQVTCVIRINLFYIILVEDNTEEETLLTLNRYINDKDNLKNLRKMEVTPAVGQLVLAHYHQDGIWYRARVIDTDNDSSLVQVFFVDYGNTEWVSEMYVRDIDPQYLHLPFQAIESSLAFADMNESVDDDSLEKVISVFRRLTDCAQPLKAKIISKDDVLKKLELQLYDVNNHDIALMLAETGYVSITSVQMTPATAFGIPG